MYKFDKIFSIREVKKVSFDAVGIAFWKGYIMSEMVLSQGESLSFDPNRISAMVKLLVKTYNNPYQSVLREYLSNAYDSHRKAGVTVPVELTLPDKDSPFLRIQDFGLGLSYDDLVNMFLLFGGTMKDIKSTDSIGGLGIGSKSALAVADHFIVRSVKDGLLNVFIFNNGDDSISYDFLAKNEETDSPNGVTVSIPMNDYTFSSQTVMNVVVGFKRSEVVVMGDYSSDHRMEDAFVEFEHGYVHKSALMGEDTNGKSYTPLQVFLNNDSDKLKMLVGPLFYDSPMPNLRAWHWYDDRKNDYQIDHNVLGYDFPNHLLEPYIIPKIPASSVTFPPSRELIEINDHNTDVLIEAYKKLDDEIIEFLKKEQSGNEIKQVVGVLHSKIGKSYLRVARTTRNNEQNDSRERYGFIEDRNNNVFGIDLTLNYQSVIDENSFRFDRLSEQKYQSYSVNACYYSRDKFCIIVNDEGTSKATVKKYLKDYILHNATFSKALEYDNEYNTYTLVLTENDYQLGKPLYDAHAVCIENFSHIKKEVLQLNKDNKTSMLLAKEERKQEKQNKQVFRYADDSGLFKHNNYQDTLRDVAGKNVFVLRRNEYHSYEEFLKSPAWDVKDKIFILENDEYADGTLRKDAEKFNGTIIDEDFIKQLIRDHLEYIIGDFDRELLKRIMLSDFIKTYDGKVNLMGQFNDRYNAKWRFVVNALSHKTVKCLAKVLARRNDAYRLTHEVLAEILGVNSDMFGNRYFSLASKILPVYLSAQQEEDWIDYYHSQCEKAFGDIAEQYQEDETSFVDSSVTGGK